MDTLEADANEVRDRLNDVRILFAEMDDRPNLSGADELIDAVDGSSDEDSLLGDSDFDESRLEEAVMEAEAVLNDDDVLLNPTGIRPPERRQTMRISRKVTMHQWPATHNPSYGPGSDALDRIGLLRLLPESACRTVRAEFDRIKESPHSRSAVRITRLFVGLALSVDHGVAARRSKF